MPNWCSRNRKPLAFPDTKHPVSNSFVTYAYFSHQDSTANEFLISIALEAISYAKVNLIPYPPDKAIEQNLNIFPGEHYRLLRGLSVVLKSRLAVEVGTYLGYGSLAMLNPSPKARVITYDISDYSGAKESLDYSKLGTRIERRFVNLNDSSAFYSQIEVLGGCDLFFVDGPKDGIFEYQLIDRLASFKLFHPKILVLDDIKFMNMISLWRSIRSPKLDLSSFGHWSGTGLVDVSRGLILD